SSIKTVAPTAGSCERHACPPVGIVIGVTDRSVGRGDLREPIGIVEGVTARSGAVGHACSSARIIIGEGDIGSGRIIYACLQSGMIEGVIDRMPVTVCMAGTLSIRIVSPALGGAVWITGSGFLVARRIREGRSVRISIGLRGEQSFLAGGIVGILYL